MYDEVGFWVCTTVVLLYRRMCAAHFSTGGIVVQVQLFLCALYHRYLDSDRCFEVRLLAAIITSHASFCIQLSLVSCSKL